MQGGYGLRPPDQAAGSGSPVGLAWDVEGRVERGGRVTVVSWNMDHWQGTDERRAAGWDYLDGRLAEQVDWDVALLQECVPPASRERVLFEPVRNGPWGTAVVTRGADLRRVAVEVSHPGCLVTGEVVLGERGLLTVPAAMFISG
jgi:hypothetical protein